MAIDFKFNGAAFKHGVSKVDILWAFNNYVYDGLIERGENECDDKHLLIGHDIDANLLEIIYNIIDEDTYNVFHAMKCRSAYKHLINAGGKNDRRRS